MKNILVRAGLAILAVLLAAGMTACFGDGASQETADSTQTTQEEVISGSLEVEATEKEEVTTKAAETADGTPIELPVVP